MFRGLTAEQASTRMSDRRLRPAWAFSNPWPSDRGIEAFSASGRDALFEAVRAGIPWGHVLGAPPNTFVCMYARRVQQSNLRSTGFQF